MSRLKEIEKEISKIKSENIENVWLHSDLTKTLAQDIEAKASKSRLDALETERLFVLDRRESWLPKTLWNLVVPIIVSILISIITTVLYSKNVSTSELYKINSDCSQKAALLAKSNSEGSDSWNVVQSIFNENEQSCLAEFTHRDLDNIRRVNEIYDLTHSKFLIVRPTFETGDDATAYTEHAKRYEDAKHRYFGK